MKIFSDVISFAVSLSIQLLESPIPTNTTTPTPTPTTTTTTSQKALSGDILQTKRGSIDPLVSKRPEKTKTTN